MHCARGDTNRGGNLESRDQSQNNIQELQVEEIDCKKRNCGEKMGVSGSSRPTSINRRCRGTEHAPIEKNHRIFVTTESRSTDAKTTRAASDHQRRLWFGTRSCFC